MLVLSSQLTCSAHRCVKLAAHSHPSMSSSPRAEEELRWERSLRRGDAGQLTAHESTAVTSTRRNKPQHAARSPAPLKTALATDNDRLKARA